MDPETLAIGNYFKWAWDPRVDLAPTPTLLIESATAPQPHTAACMGRQRDTGGLEELFQEYGIRYYTTATMAELGFTVNTLLGMKEEELDEMMNSLSRIFRWELLVGERYGVKAAVRAERKRIEEEDTRRRHLVSGGTSADAIDALSHEVEKSEIDTGLSEELDKEAAGSGGDGATSGGVKKKIRRRKGQKKVVDADEEGEYEDDENGADNGKRYERQREHPFIVTEPGEVARGKKNGLDYLFHLYEQCRELLIQVQNIAKEHGEKCPTKVTNQVFRYAKKSGASYINKPKMRHYVHCYALHCLDEDASNALRRSFKERGENIGAWREACYKPLVTIAARRGWDIDAIFNADSRLAIWYVPTKLRQLCHLERNNASASSSVPGIATTSSAICLY